MPVDFAMLPGKGLFVIPGGLVVVETLALNFATISGSIAEKPLRGHGYPSIDRALPQRTESPKRAKLLAGRIDPEVFDGFLDTEEVLAHDFTGALLAGRRFETAVLNQPNHLCGRSLPFESTALWASAFRKLSGICILPF